MWYKLLISTIIFGFMAIIQITLLGGFGNYFGSINLLLATLVVMLFLIDFRLVVYFTILAGLILDIYSALPFGVFMISYFLAIVISDFLLLNFFTNKSFYSVILAGLLAVVAFQATFLAVSGLVYLLGVSDFYIDKSYWLKLFYQMVNMTILLGMMFLVVNRFSQKFKPNFIRS